MMHYRKGENVEQETKKTDLPFDDCMPKGQNDFLWMQVKGGTHVKNVISYAKNALEKGEYRTLVWSGSGGGLVKTVSCAEIIKRSFPLYQVTRMGYTSVEEHWKPTMEGLEEIVARRQIPCLHILMSLEPIEIKGVQKPGTTTYMLHRNDASTSTAAQTRENNGQRGQRYRGSGGAQKKNKRPQKEQQHLKEQPRPSQNQPQNAESPQTSSAGQSKPHVADNTQTGSKKKTTTPENRQQKSNKRQRKPKEAAKTDTPESI